MIKINYQINFAGAFAFPGKPKTVETKEIKQYKIEQYKIQETTNTDSIKKSQREDSLIKHIDIFA